MADIFREVDEEIRRERLGALGRRFGPYILAVVLLALAVAGGAAWWRSHQAHERVKDAAALMQAQGLLDSGKPKEAADAFAHLADTGGGGYPTLARFQQAEALLAAKDRKGAVAALDGIAANSDDAVFRQLAQLKAALIQVGDAPRPEVEKRLAPLMDPNSPFRYSAREARAAAALQAKDREAALSMLQQLAEDPDAPRGVQHRARELLAALGAPAKPVPGQAEPAGGAAGQAGTSE